MSRTRHTLVIALITGSLVAGGCGGGGRRTPRPGRRPAPQPPRPPPTRGRDHHHLDGHGTSHDRHGSGRPHRRGRRGVLVADVQQINRLLTQFAQHLAAASESRSPEGTASGAPVAARTVWTATRPGSGATVSDAPLERRRKALAAPLRQVVKVGGVFVDAASDGDYARTGRRDRVQGGPRSAADRRRKVTR